MTRSLPSQEGVTKNIVGVVLAAGQSRRMGHANKLTMLVDGTPMVARVVDTLQRSDLERVLVVTGHEPEEIRNALSGREVELVHNPDFEEGMGTSVRVGVTALGDDVDGVLIALADMPSVTSDVIDRLIGAFSPGGEVSIYIPMYGEKRGNPVLWDAQWFPELRKLAGDVGGKVLFHRHPTAIRYVDVKSPSVNLDVDTPDALDEL